MDAFGRTDQHAAFLRAERLRYTMLQDVAVSSSWCAADRSVGAISFDSQGVLENEKHMESLSPPHLGCDFNKCFGLRRRFLLSEIYK